MAKKKPQYSCTITFPNGSSCDLNSEQAKIEMKKFLEEELFSTPTKSKGKDDTQPK